MRWFFVIFMLATERVHYITDIRWLCIRMQKRHQDDQV
jgi:hypothetical protein